MTRRSFFMTAFAPLLLRRTIDVSQIPNEIFVCAVDHVTGIRINFVTRDTQLKPGKTIDVHLPDLPFAGEVQYMTRIYDR